MTEWTLNKSSNIYNIDETELTTVQAQNMSLVRKRGKRSATVICKGFTYFVHLILHFFLQTMHLRGGIAAFTAYCSDVLLILEIRYILLVFAG